MLYLPFIFDLFYVIIYNSTFKKRENIGGEIVKRAIKKAINEMKKPMIILKRRNNKKKLKNQDFTIISNNCWGGFVYQDFDVQYNTPFIGLFLHPTDYIKLLSNLKHYLQCKLSFTDSPKYHFDTIQKNYPVGVLDDIEIYFLHYKSKEEAYQKWNRRLKRVNIDTLFIAFAETKACTIKDIEEFNDLSFNNKVCFTANQYENFKDCVLIKGYEKQGYLSSDYLKKYKKHFDIAKWLNSGGNAF